MKRASGERWVNHLTDCRELERVSRCWQVCGRQRRGPLKQGKVTWPYHACGGLWSGTEIHQRLTEMSVIH